MNLWLPRKESRLLRRKIARILLTRLKRKQRKKSKKQTKKQTKENIEMSTIAMQIDDTVIDAAWEDNIKLEVML